jgi:hypothetical protein
MEVKMSRQKPVAFQIIETNRNNRLSSVYYLEAVPKTCEVDNVYYTYKINPLFLAPPDYEALKENNIRLDDILSSVIKERNNAEQAATVEAKIADEFRAERDRLQREIVNLVRESLSIRNDALEEAACLAAPPYQSGQLKFDDYPEFNHFAMGCGLEDAGHIDRYDAMRYGWDQAIEMLGERINNFLAAPKGEIK